MKIKQPNDLVKTLLQQEYMIIWRDWKKKILFRNYEKNRKILQKNKIKIYNK